MKLPSSLENLYKHWSDHTKPHAAHSIYIEIDEDLVADIKAFATERMLIWDRKSNGSSAPFTKDPILCNYRFCNIYRELDRQTIELHTMLRNLENDFDLWLLNTAFTRFVCKPETVRKVGLLNFDKANNEKVMKKLQALPRPKYGNAYVFPISVIQKSTNPTREEFFCRHLPDVIKDIASIVQQQEKTAVPDLLQQILPAFGFNFKFHWTEILIDTAYQFPDKIDLFKKFPIGPGATPTLKKLSHEDPEFLVTYLAALDFSGFPYLEYNDKPVMLSAENWEGIACEFRKYSNLQKGTGRKRLFR